MAYTPPAGNAVGFSWQSKSAYVPDAGGAVQVVWEVPAIDVSGTVSSGPVAVGDVYQHINKLDGALSFGPVASGSVFHYQQGQSEAPIKLNVVTPFQYLAQTSSAPIRIKVVEQGQSEAPIQILVDTNSGQSEAPIVIDVYESGQSEAPITIGVVEDDILWSATVVVGGVDYSARINGDISVEGEEGVARIARFLIVPYDGAIQPFSFSGASVYIDYISNDGGIAVPTRVFTGLVDNFEYDPVTRLVAFYCTDNLQNRIAAMTRGSLDYITGGRFHTSISGEDVLDNWEYTQECMRAVPGSLDAGAYGQLRVTLWNSSVSYKEYGEGKVLDESLSIDLARRADIINRVNVGYQFRFSRLRQRYTNVRWTIDPYFWASQTIPVLSKDTVENALDQTGWNIEDATYTPFPKYLYIDKYGQPYIPVGLSLDVFTVIHILDPENTCMELSARLSLRFSQTVTEEYDIRVEAPESIDVNGELATEFSASLESGYDPSDWENDYTLEPKFSTAHAKENVLDYYPDLTEADRTDAIEILIDIGETEILRAHRNTRVTFSTPCTPDADLTWRVRVNTGPVVAQGKVAQFVHELDVDAGSAITTMTIAVSGHGSLGITPVATPKVAPDSPAIPEGEDFAVSPFGSGYQTYIGGKATSPTYSENWMGWIVNVRSETAIQGFASTLPSFVKTTNKDGTVTYTNEQKEGYAGSWVNPDYVAATAFPETGFRVILPGVDAAYRNPVEPQTESIYNVVIPEDEFVLQA